MPESIRWLERKGRINDAIREVEKYYGVKLDPTNLPSAEVQVSRPVTHPPLWFRFIVAVMMMTANDVGFGLLSYEVGPIYFSSQTAL